MNITANSFAVFFITKIIMKFKKLNKFLIKLTALSSSLIGTAISN